MKRVDISMDVYFKLLIFFSLFLNKDGTKNSVELMKKNFQSLFFFYSCSFILMKNMYIAQWASKRTLGRKSETSPFSKTK